MKFVGSIVFPNLESQVEGLFKLAPLRSSFDQPGPVVPVDVSNWEDEGDNKGLELVS